MEPTEQKERKPYLPPTLIEYGDVIELTQSGRNGILDPLGGGSQGA